MSCDSHVTYHIGDKVECDNDVDDKKDGCGRVLAVTPQHDVRVTGGGGGGGWDIVMVTLHTRVCAHLAVVVDMKRLTNERP